MRSLSVRITCLVSALVVMGGCERQEKPPAPPPAPTPVKASAPAPVMPSQSTTEAELRERLRCEVLLGFSGLLAGQQEFFGEKDTWTADLKQLPAPAACTDGSRVSTLDGAWLAGCHFRYAVSVAGSHPDNSTFSVRAVGVGGLAEGLTYTMTHGYADRRPVRVWPSELVLEDCHGVRRPEGTPLPAPLCEGASNLKGFFTAQKSYFGEKDRYSESAVQVYFAPEPCLDGTRAPVPDDTWTAGCHFIYRAEVSGTAPEQTFRLTARGMKGPVVEQKLTLDSQYTWSPADPGCTP
ncbi:hypothetical protein JYK02_28950 [Corallococcus macrosporus]|uniref:Lipoprotein n=1 Tax=Corallococcus macrosporus TaxID=35 RepID=A0ABS3DJT7_9BACT|nr:hypothetical protein [Corallococcus macrosporus]MBN8231548.1 hypothetical protein [Corallococcus macrosporus]